MLVGPKKWTRSAIKMDCMALYHYVTAEELVQKFCIGFKLYTCSLGLGLISDLYSKVAWLA